MWNGDLAMKSFTFLKRVFKKKKEKKNIIVR